MSAAAGLASLRAMGRPLVTTRDAAARLGLSTSASSHLMRRLANAGAVLAIRRGLWALESNVDPMQLAAWATAPYPSYVSLWSALHAHGMLAQIPRETHVVSVGRPQRIQTPLGILVVHRVAPEVFGGYEINNDVPLATPAKAIFDLAYLSAPRVRPWSCPGVVGGSASDRDVSGRPRKRRVSEEEGIVGTR
jgi:predicted transcriptional regulator of viral defense system